MFFFFNSAGFGARIRVHLADGSVERVADQAGVANTSPTIGYLPEGVEPRIGSRSSRAPLRPRYR